jgi:HD-GYP domain-containing protein (c-di-GMP phosphodiesterase class II)
MAGARSLLTRTEQTQRPALRQAKRLVQPIVDSLMKNEYSILGLTALKDHDEYTYAHCVNVSVLSIRMGQVLGLRRDELANLGVAALLHDVGKLAVPADVLNKPGALSEQEWAMIRRHPLEGVKMLARMPGWSTLTLSAMHVCFQHHVNMDGTGYPRVSGAASPSVFSRIVSVADVFDAITMHRAYRKRAFTSYEALHHLAVAERKNFDPAVLWALVESIGLFPAGTVMETSSGYLVLSLGPNPRDLSRPACRILQSPDGDASGAWPDWAMLPETESVVRVLSPEEHELDTNTLMAA